ncbi:uncharacterized protein V6R79_010856 [Siganus canaliculatus]
METTPTKERPELLHIHRQATREALGGGEGLLRAQSRHRSAAGAVVRSVSVAAPLGAPVMLALGCREAAQELRGDWTKIVYADDDSLRDA